MIAHLNSQTANQWLCEFLAALMSREADRR